MPQLMIHNRTPFWQVILKKHSRHSSMQLCLIFCKQWKSFMVLMWHFNNIILANSMCDIYSLLMTMHVLSGTWSDYSTLIDFMDQFSLHTCSYIKNFYSISWPVIFFVFYEVIFFRYDLIIWSRSESKSSLPSYMCSGCEVSGFSGDIRYVTEILEGQTWKSARHATFSGVFRETSSKPIKIQN